MYLTDSVPVSLLIVIVLRDLILGLLLIKMKSAGLPPFKVTYLGKAATFNLLYALPLLLLTSTSLGALADVAFITGWAFAGWGIALYIYTGFTYGISGVKLLRRRNEIEGK